MEIHVKDIHKYPELSAFTQANKHAKKIVHTGTQAFFTLKTRVPGLNGDDGLIREHFMKAKKRKTLYQKLLKEQNQPQISGQVRVIFTRYATRLMDWDNHGASFKHLGDALVKLGIIEDDNPTTIQTFLPKQIKVDKKIEEKITIEILKLN